MILINLYIVDIEIFERLTNSILAYLINFFNVKYTKRDDRA